MYFFLVSMIEGIFKT